MVLPARKLTDAHQILERNSPSAAVLKFRLGDGEAQALCARLLVQEIPFMVRSGDSHAAQEGAKPMDP